ncbi:25128_t:CDS:1, partial [Dentiscutata erythropus]
LTCISTSTSLIPTPTPTCISVGGTCVSGGCCLDSVGCLCVPPAPCVCAA